MGKYVNIENYWLFFDSLPLVSAIHLVKRARNPINHNLQEEKKVAPTVLAWQIDLESKPDTVQSCLKLYVHILSRIKETIE